MDTNPKAADAGAAAPQDAQTKDIAANTAADASTGAAAGGPENAAPESVSADQADSPSAEAVAAGLAAKAEAEAEAEAEAVKAAEKAAADKLAAETKAAEEKAANELKAAAGAVSAAMPDFSKPRDVMPKESFSMPWNGHTINFAAGRLFHKAEVGLLKALHEAKALVEYL